VDTITGCLTHHRSFEAIRKRKTAPAGPSCDLDAGNQADSDGVRPGGRGEVLDAEAALACNPDAAPEHDGPIARPLTETIRDMDLICRMIRERGMVPGLSTHMPETILFADKTGLDVETYISIYNAMGFLMQLEVDWIARIIEKANKPVLCIADGGRPSPCPGLRSSGTPSGPGHGCRHHVAQKRRVH
jgi:hypothetical protein